MAGWDDLPHVVWNGFFAIVWLAALVAILRDPVWRYKKGWLAKGGTLFFALALTGAALLEVPIFGP